MSRDTLIAKLKPVVEYLRDLELEAPEVARRAVAARFPVDSPEITEIRHLAEAGHDDGWLTPKENGAIRFGRLEKSLQGFSIDAVWMSEPGPRHRHPRGEVDLCFALTEGALFDGHPEGWVVYPPESSHVPTVSDGTMLILYFLPDGAIDFSA